MLFFEIDFYKKLPKDEKRIVDVIRSKNISEDDILDNMNDFNRAKSELKNAQKFLDNLKDVFLSIDEAKKKLDSYKATIEEAELAYDISQKRYSSGVGTQLETIDAMVSLTRAKVNYYNSIYDYYILHAQLDQLLANEIELSNTR